MKKLGNWCVVEDVAVGRIGEDREEGGFAACDYGDGTVVEARGRGPVCEPAFGTEVGKLRVYYFPGFVVGGFEVEEEDEGFLGLGGEYSGIIVVSCCCAVGECEVV